MQKGPKISLTDDGPLRTEIHRICETTDRRGLARWSILLAGRALHSAGLDPDSIECVREGFAVNGRWQEGLATVGDVRRAAFVIHRIARACESETERAALRAAGHAVASGHVGEHALVASDYAVRTACLADLGDIGAATRERLLQLEELRGASEHT